jgi:hypothetical protein
MWKFKKKNSKMHLTLTKYNFTYKLFWFRDLVFVNRSVNSVYTNYLLS